jgi:acetoacetyl-CoA reductase
LNKKHLLDNYISCIPISKSGGVIMENRKIAIVTGGTRGIGKAISVGLKNDGYFVIANYTNNIENAQKFEEETGIITRRWDVANFEECQKNIEAIESEFLGMIQILINNAGISKDSMLHKLEPENWNNVLNTNLNSCYNMSRSVINKMREQNYGRIVNISSINALAGNIGVTNYSAAKAGILGFTRALAKESASKGITVNAVAPGYVDTELLANVPQNVMQDLIEQIPIKRLGKPEEISRVVRFLVSPESGFITGETISINGGHYMH